MDQVVDINVLLEFENITQFPLTLYFKRVNSFFKKDYPSIINYYSGNLDSLNSQSFTNLQSLLEDMQSLMSSISLHKQVLNNYKWFVLVDQIEHIDSSLQLVDNASKWLRSTISKGNFNPNPEVDIPFNQGQTLESIERDTLGSVDWDNTWSDLATKNDLREEDYTSQAGFLLKANFNYVLNNFRITAIVDNPTGDKILGIDLNKKILFDTATEDLVVLSPKETFFQNAEVLINLRKGDNPEFYDQGLNPKLIVGSNVNSITFPVLFRQLSQLFRADDTIKSFTILTINRKQDAVFMEFEISSRLGEVQNISLKI